MAILSGGATTWADFEVMRERSQLALESFDWQETQLIAREIASRVRSSGDLPPLPEVKKLLKALRRKRRFGELEEVAEALLEIGDGVLDIESLYAQSLIDQGRLVSARTMLQRIVADASTSPSEHDEAMGLLGRASKQLFVNAHAHPDRALTHLREALRWYGEGFQKDRSNYWHGINVVALAARAQRDGMEVGNAYDIAALATEVLETTTRGGSADDPWVLATRVEANLALGRWEALFESLARYVAHPHADAFEVASTLRQLKEIWGLGSEDDGHGPAIVATLESALLARSGGGLSLASGDLHALRNGLQRASKSLEGELEKNFSDERRLPLPWLKAALARCGAVARIEDRMERPWGTGFLVNPNAFFEHLSPLPKNVLLTNFHVINSSGKQRGLRPDNAAARFEVGGTPYRVKRLLAELEDLDACFVELEAPELAACCPLEPQADPFEPGRKPPQRVYVIGHPAGGSLSISLHDSFWLDFDGTYLQYRTPTEHGSSGSPVFDERSWTLIALHRRGSQALPRLGGKSGTHEANEGVAIEVIRRAVSTLGLGAHRTSAA